MKGILFALCAVLAVVTARVVIEPKVSYLLGAKECTWGPSYWCINITNSAKCNTTQHCIKKVWETMKVEDDTDSVCTICKDMVQQARDQLESNETQEDLKSVFEGSCALMKIKPVVEECDKLVDEFIPQLIETLASQMNPSVVCSVAGLCNSKHIDHLIANHKKLLKVPLHKGLSLSDDELQPDECLKCYTIATHMETKFKSSSRDKVLDDMISMCGHMSSFSDACSSIVIEYFSTIYSHLQEHFRANNICHLSGQCSGKYHKHEDSKDIDVEIRPLSSVGIVEVGDDLPCKLCEQLVGHLRDLLVANTTENEFQQVLEGMCKQTKSFADECKSIVDQYYPQIYNYLVNGLDSDGVCRMAGICPPPDKEIHDGPIWPLLPEKSLTVGKKMMEKRKNLGENGAGTRHEVKKTEAEEMQLPIERIVGPSLIMGAPQMDVKGKQVCAFCEYVLHDLQETITNPKTEEKLKEFMSGVCEKVPHDVVQICKEFMDTYSDAVVALLAQEIDPSVVCPTIHVCPSDKFMEAWEKIPKSMMLESEVKDKPSCPLCLFAVDQLKNMVKDDKTEDKIKESLDSLCNYLSKGLKEECTDLVNAYSKELIEKLMEDLPSTEICASLKLCDPKKNSGSEHLVLLSDEKEHALMTNEVPQSSPVNKNVVESMQCEFCKVAMTYLEKELKQKKTRDEVEDLVHGICNRLPKKWSDQCNGFVNQYADFVIEMLSDEVTPAEICDILKLCEQNMKRLHESVSECALCQGIISKIDELMVDPKVNHAVDQVVSEVCDHIAAAKHDKCVMMMEVYEQSIINILNKKSDRMQICRQLALCSTGDYFVMLLGHKNMLQSPAAKISA